jgi:hypothetical protein
MTTYTYGLTEVTILDTLTALNQQLSGINANTISGISNNVGQINTILNGVNTNVNTILTNTNSIMTNGSGNIGDSIQAYDSVKNYFNDTWKGINDTFSTFNDTLSGTWDELKADIETTMSYSGAIMGTAIHDLQQSVYNNYDAMTSFINGTITDIGTTLDNVTNPLVYAISDAVDIFQNTIKGLTEFSPSKFQGIFGSLFESQKDIFSKLMNTGS